MYEYRATIERWVDGDTVDVSIDLGLAIHTKQRLRLYGIDTPELRGSERKHGQEARLYAQGACPPGSPVTIQTIRDKAGKYGRYLAYIYYADEKHAGETTCLNQELIEAGHAVESP